MAFRLISRRSTGLLDITSELRDGWTGTLTIEREGADVYFRGRLNGSAAASEIPWMLPAGFRPGTLTVGPAQEYGSGLAWTRDTVPRPIRISHYLNRFHLVGGAGLTSEIDINHHLRTRDAMPTNLPGVSI